jgi:hypothetical protein
MRRNDNLWLRLLLLGLLAVLGYLQTYHSPQRTPASPPQSQVVQTGTTS